MAAGTVIGSTVYCLTVMSRQNRWSVKAGALDHIMGCYCLPCIILFFGEVCRAAALTQCLKPCQTAPSHTAHGKKVMLEPTK